MQEFDKIYLSWRKGQGNGRYLVGVISFPVSGEVTFTYDKAEVEKAKKDGFSPYTEFQNVDALYSQNVLDIFAQRLTKSVRPDVQSYYNFWEIDRARINDKAYMLAHTQGLLTTDNFEFLADYNPVPSLRFLTDLAHTEQQQLPANTLQKGDILEVKLDPKNEFDPMAVTAHKSGTLVGYIKRVHCHLFHKAGGDAFKLTVKAVEQNGIVKRVFVSVAR